MAKGVLTKTFLSCFRGGVQTKNKKRQKSFDLIAQDDSPFPKLYADNLIGGGHLLGLGALPESVLESAGHGLHVSHAAGADGATALGLLSPVEISHLLAGVSAGSTGLLLDVVRHLAASAAGGVRLVVSPSERGGTLSLLVSKKVGVGGERRKEELVEHNMCWINEHFPQFCSIASDAHVLEYCPTSIGRGYGRCLRGTRAQGGSSFGSNHSRRSP